MFSRFIRVVAGMSTSFLLIAEYYFILLINQFVYPKLAPRFLALTMDIHVQILLAAINCPREVCGRLQVVPCSGGLLPLPSPPTVREAPWAGRLVLEVLTFLHHPHPSLGSLGPLLFDDCLHRVLDICFHLVPGTCINWETKGEHFPWQCRFQTLQLASCICCRDKCQFLES